MSNEPHILDARGLVCPDPIREAEQAIRPLPQGRRMVIQVTDTAAPIDFEAWCFHRGHQYLGAREVDTWLEIVVIKGPADIPA